MTCEYCNIRLKWLGYEWIADGWNDEFQAKTETLHSVWECPHCGLRENIPTRTRELKEES